MSAKKRSSNISAASSNTNAPPAVPATAKSISILVAQLQAGISLAALALAVAAAEVNLAPLFGGTASRLLLNRSIGVLAVSLAFLPSLKLRRLSNASFLSGFICASPAVLQLLGVSAARSKRPVIGPLLAYVPVFVPLLYFAINLVRDLILLLVPRFSHSYGVKSLIGVAIPTIILTQQPMLKTLSQNTVLNPSYLLVFSGWLLGATVVLPSFRNSSNPSGKKSKKSTPPSWIPLSIVLASSLASLLSQPLRPLSLPYTHPSRLLRILSSKQSITGRIVVAEDYTHGFRFLRADHSLLGGVWIGNKAITSDPDVPVATAKDGTKLGDSIYSAFVLQEAARLHERNEPQKKALMIGLGVGIAAEAFMKHGLETSVIEIDPAVYTAATDYFGLSKPAAIHLEDARSWVAREAAAGKGKYDIVVHDCFSGGGVPVHLFTVEFWSDLRQIMSQEGIVAVNYAGSISGDSAQAIVATLEHVFGQCRAFHDYNIDATEDKLASEFINVVFFCSPSPLPLTFRVAEKEDYLASHLREHILKVLPAREVPSSILRGKNSTVGRERLILTDNHNSLAKWQDQNALEHWRVMRNMLPDFLWETY